ncbi:unnamed protein product [Zymoseptoria tritici ST99CH_1A5]|uniref:Uncharacterized protein n=3 Tax=Zymoseptoria tritici TaxID=1047171 RepID=A0A1X7RZZ2_ZYMT9|nr:unnamed protein product [Zymoseptoria tritici ST99CH_3D7]SMR55776.1 unnamed protein product [Zymoseptoria tritici ST99CH_1E4]SMR58148.1 unnamed protein product [Zymoseptoria tritici ST99CH_3D1]SMY26580.1 unnamed protein product [Zymoseptoria tritici ST99CH_1A5]
MTALGTLEKLPRELRDLVYAHAAAHITTPYHGQALPNINGTPQLPLLHLHRRQGATFSLLLSNSAIKRELESVLDTAAAFSTTIDFRLFNRSSEAVPSIVRPPAHAKSVHLTIYFKRLPPINFTPPSMRNDLAPALTLLAVYTRRYPECLKVECWTDHAGRYNGKYAEMMEYFEWACQKGSQNNLRKIEVVLRNEVTGVWRETRNERNEGGEWTREISQARAAEIMDTP